MKLSVDAAGAELGAIQTNVRPLTLQEASERAAQLMTTEYRELIATLPTDWPKRGFAWLRVNGPSGAEAITTGDVFQLEAWMKTALLSIIDGGLSPEISTPESVADLARLRKEVAYFKLLPESAAEASETETAPAEPTEADLDAAVIHDWNSLITSEIRSKCRDEAYKARLDRLMLEGRLGR